MNPQVPIYISVAFLIAILFPIYMIASLFKKNAKPHQSLFVFFGVVLFYLFYLITVGMACLQGAFDEITLPPQIVLWTTLPLLIFLVGFVFNTGIYQDILQETPLNELIRLHVFRLIGSFFLILMLLQMLPKTFAMVAGLGDLTTAISSSWVAKIIRERKNYAQSVALVWNTFGFLDILITSTLAILFTKISIDTGSTGVEVLASFPFCFVPAFAPATIIFLHLSIYRKLLSKKFR